MVNLPNIIPTTALRQDAGGSVHWRHSGLRRGVCLVWALIPGALFLAVGVTIVADYGVYSATQYISSTLYTGRYGLYAAMAPGETLTSSLRRLHL